jgi:hypothetical protein
VEVYFRASTSALNGNEWSASGHGRFTPGEKALGSHDIGSWVGPRAGLDAVAPREIILRPESIKSKVKVEINLFVRVL